MELRDNFIRIKDKKKLYYGGKQGWCKQKYMQATGCGVIGCANLIFYISTNDRKKVIRDRRKPGQKETITGQNETFGGICASSYEISGRSEGGSEGRNEWGKGQNETTKGRNETPKGHSETSKGHNETLKGHSETSKGHSENHAGMNETFKDGCGSLEIQEMNENGTQEIVNGHGETIKGYDENLGRYEKNISGYSENIKRDGDKVKGQNETIKGHNETVKGHHETAKGYGETAKGHNETNEAQKNTKKGRYETSSGKNDLDRKDRNILMKTDYMELVEHLRRRFLPVLPKFGINGVLLSLGMNMFFLHNRMGYYTRWGVFSWNFLKAIKGQLENNIPVILAIGPGIPFINSKGRLNLYQKDGNEYKVSQTTRAHYVTITGIDERWMTVSSWGELYYIKISEYMEYVKKSSNWIFSNILVCSKIRK